MLVILLFALLFDNYTNACPQLAEGHSNETCSKVCNRKHFPCQSLDACGQDGPIYVLIPIAIGKMNSN